MITQREDVNLVPVGVLERIHVSQYDVGSRTLVFDLIASGVMDVSGISANIEGLKPDGNYFSYECTVSGATVSLPIEQQMTACAGEVICTLKLYRDDDVLRTINFILDVEEKPMPTDAVVSETEIPAIIELGRQHAEKSEAYAVGKVNGVDVSSTDEAYHNNSKYYSEEAGTSASNAHISEVNAKTSEDNAKDSEDNAKASELASAASEANASNSATASSNSATASSNSATLSESYAKGGTNARTGEDTDNSKYYKERCEQIVADLGYPINPKGPITFSQLPTSGMQYGWMYQITDSFTTDNRFVEGTGEYVNENAEVYWTSQDKWAIMQGSGVTGVKGSAEQSYRKGQVNITPQNLGLATVATSGSYNDLEDKPPDLDISVILNKVYPIGCIIESTTCSTLALVKETYGGDNWIQHTGYMLRGATSGVTADQAQKDGGSDTFIPSGTVSRPTFSGTAASLSHSGGTVGNHTLTIAEMPWHNHSGVTSANYAYDTTAIYRPNGSENFVALNWEGAYVGSDTKFRDRTYHSHSISAQGDNGAHSHPFTQPTAHSYTPAGLVSKPSFKGIAGDSVPNYKNVYIWERTA